MVSSADDRWVHRADILVCPHEQGPGLPVVVGTGLVARCSYTNMDEVDLDYVRIRSFNLALKIPRVLDSFISVGRPFHVLTTLFEKKYFLTSVLALFAMMFFSYPLFLVCMWLVRPTRLNQVSVLALDGYRP